jgi:hypothetical protein
MNFKLSTLAAVAALLAFCLPEARAEDMAPMEFIGAVGQWRINANDKLCQAKALYADDTVLEFVINSRGAAFISIENPKWTIPKGDYEIFWWVDRAPVTTHTAAGRNTWLWWQFPLNEESINLLSYGRTLYVMAGQQSYRYELVRSEAMLKSLLSCAGPRMATGNPFADPPPAATSKTPAPPVPASAESPSNPFRRL